MAAFFILCDRERSAALNLSGTKAACAYIHALSRAFYEHSNMLDIRMPRFIRPSVGMADVIAEMNALAADFTFCHDSNPP